MSKTYTRYFLWIVTTVLAASCAQIVPPSGGAKDFTPPQAIKYLPDSAALNFKGNEIVILFNEYIQLRDPQSQVVVSPPLPSAPTVRVKNKALNITLEDTLQDNTTYSINFGSSIRDITEGNPLNNFQYVFSTGSFIDSLSVVGRITDAFTQRAPKDVLVLLYENLSDSIPYKRMPSYFGKTDERGMFRINNMRPGTYKAFALKDANLNYLYDQPGEKIGFMKEPLVVSKKNDTLNMTLFQEESTKTSINKTSSLQYGKLLLVLNKSAERLELQPLGIEMKAPPIIEYSDKRDSIFFWYRDIDNDAISIRIVHNGEVLDTARYSLIKKSMLSGKNKFELEMRTNVSKAMPLDLEENIQIVFNHPIAQNDLSRIILTKGSDTLKYEAGFTDPVHRKFRISYPFESDSTYSLTLQKGAFEDMFGLTSDTMNIPFKVQAKKFYGAANIKISLPGEGSYILQLLNEKEDILEETIVNSSSMLKYPLLKPGNYRLRLIQDTNANNKWDTGNYMEKRQPEEVRYFPGTINIRSNWDLDLEWPVEL